MTEGTIFAVATAPGQAGVAVIRISGPDTRFALDALGIPLPPARRAQRAYPRELASGQVIDDGIVLFFPAPRSFTGEDVAELQVHGGRGVTAAILDNLGRVQGCRPAEAGEFSRRAFLNGKLDLTAVEGIADLVAAETEAQRRQARRQVDGELGRLYDAWRFDLVRALAHVEAEIDFPEEGLPDELSASVRATIDRVMSAIGRHLVDARRGERLRAGLSIAIVGPPNVGKSSILNVLARRDVAITASTAGTTRDVLEVHLDLGGYPVTVADTAGLRDATADPVEIEGIRRARSRAESADLQLVVVAADRLDQIADMGVYLGPDALWVVNKQDLSHDRAGWPTAAIGVSAATGEGVGDLVAQLQSLVARRLVGDGLVPTRSRHVSALRDCMTALQRATGADLVELMAEDLRLAVRSLGRITGAVDVEDLLDVIFREFCIGK